MASDNRTATVPESVRTGVVPSEDRVVWGSEQGTPAPGDVLVASSGAIGISGGAAGLLATRTLPMAAGSVALTGGAATLRSNRVVSAAAGSVALTGSDVTLTVVSNTLLNGITLWHKMDETSGTRSDSHGSNDLADINTVGSAAGRIGNAANFVAASSEYLNLADNADVSPTGSFTFSCWVYPGTLSQGSGVNPIIGKDGGAGRSYLFQLGNTPNEFLSGFVFSSAGPFCSFQTAARVTPGSWHHLVFGWDSSDGKAFGYIDNGTVTKSAATISDVKDSVTDFRVGSRVFGSYFNGRIDLLGGWMSRVLTADERTDLNNGGSGLDYPF